MMKQLADCVFSLFQQQVCKVLLKQQSGKPVIAVCVIFYAKEINV